MASRIRSVAGSIFGAAAGLGAALPPLTCAGGACASCLACLGVGGAAASLLLVGLVSRRRCTGHRQNDTTSHFEVPMGDAPSLPPPSGRCGASKDGREELG